jgi:hypothetical protein
MSNSPSYCNIWFSTSYQQTPEGMYTTQNSDYDEDEESVRAARSASAKEMKPLFGAHKVSHKSFHSIASRSAMDEMEVRPKYCSLKFR